MVRQQILKGTDGRQKNRYVLMCSECAAKTQEGNKVIATISLVAVVVFALIVLAVRGY